MVREVSPAGATVWEFRPPTFRTTCSTRCKSRNACPMGTRSSIPGSISGMGRRIPPLLLFRRWKSHRQEDRLGVARVGKPGGSRTCDHDSVAGCAGRSRGGAFRRFEITGRRDIGRRAGGDLHQFHRSHGLDIDDALITAAAAVHGCAWWTRNRKHYPMKDIELI